MSLSLWFTIGLVWFGELIITSAGEPEPREKKISGSGAGEKKKKNFWLRDTVHHFGSFLMIWGEGGVLDSVRWMNSLMNSSVSKL